MIVTFAPASSFLASAWSWVLSDALSAKLPAAKLRSSAAGIFGCFAGTVVVGLEVRGVIEKVNIDTAPAGSEPPVWRRQHVHGDPVPVQ